PLSRPRPRTHAVSPACSWSLEDNRPLTTVPAADLRTRVRELMPQVRADLERLVRIPSVSADGHDPAPLVKSAELVAELLRAVGADTRVLRAEGGHPAVVGYFKAPPGKPSVLLYAHHDVQPPGPDSEWKDR